MKLLSTIFLCLPVTFLFSQSSDQYIIAPQGDFSVGHTMSMSWTIGDLVTASAKSDEMILTQGFQQPILSVHEINSVQSNEISNQSPIVSGRSNTPPNQEALRINVYPNPAGTDVTLKVENSNKEYSIDIFDQSGTLLSRRKSRSPQEIINLSELPAAQYLLRISLTDSNQSKTFQVVKSK